MDLPQAAIVLHARALLLISAPTIAVLNAATCATTYGFAIERTGL